MFLKKLNNNKFLIITIVLIVVLVAPMLYLSTKGYMSQDDYIYGADTHAVYVKTGSLCATFLEAFDVSRWWYKNWQGSFVSVFLMQMHPGIFSQTAYRVGLVFIFVSFILALIVLGITVNKHHLKMKGKYLAFLLISILFLWTQYFASPFEGLYWYNSSIYYTFTFAVVMLSIYLMIKFSNTSKKPSKNISFFIWLVSLILIGGSNYPISLTSAVALLSFVIYMFIKKSKNKYLYLAGLIIFLSAFLFNVFSPGNSLRMGIYERLSLGRMIYLCVAEFGLEMIKWTFKMPTLALVFVSVVFLPNTLKEVKIKYMHPIILGIIFTLLLLSQYVPSVFAIGTKGPVRAENIRYIIYILFACAFTINFIGWCIAKNSKVIKFINRARTLIIVTSLGLAVVSLYLYPLKQMWGVKSITCIGDESIETLCEEMDKRIEHLEENGTYLNPKYYDVDLCVNEMIRPYDLVWWEYVDEFYRGEPFTRE